jgi:hypothetical protein
MSIVAPARVICLTMVEPSYSDRDLLLSSANSIGCISTRQSAILDNDRIDQLAALHATLTAIVRQILAPLSNHETAAARAMIRSFDS